MTRVELGAHGESAQIDGHGKEYGYAQVVMSMSGGEACIKTVLTLDIMEARYLAMALLLEADRAIGDRHLQMQLQHCGVCKETQFLTHGGFSCPNGHGGAPSAESVGDM